MSKGGRTVCPEPSGLGSVVEGIFQGRGRPHPDRVTKVFFGFLGYGFPSEFQEEGVVVFFRISIRFRVRL
jgi:hypothetical protein